MCPGDCAARRHCAGSAIADRGRDRREESCRQGRGRKAARHHFGEDAGQDQGSRRRDGADQLGEASQQDAAGEHQRRADVRAGFRRHDRLADQPTPQPGAARDHRAAGGQNPPGRRRLRHAAARLQSEGQHSRARRHGGRAGHHDAQAESNLENRRRSRRSISTPRPCSSHARSCSSSREPERPS